MLEETALIYARAVVDARGRVMEKGLGEIKEGEELGVLFEELTVRQRKYIALQVIGWGWDDARRYGGIKIKSIRNWGKRQGYVQIESYILERRGQYSQAAAAWIGTQKLMAVEQLGQMVVEQALENWGRMKADEKKIALEFWKEINRFTPRGDPGRVGESLTLEEVILKRRKVTTRLQPEGSA